MVLYSSIEEVGGAGDPTEQPARHWKTSGYWRISVLDFILADIEKICSEHVFYRRYWSF